MVLTLVHLLAAASPGPDFALVTRQSLIYGRRAGLLASLGISLGLAIHISYSAAGLAAVIVHTAQWMKAIRVAGGAYLIFLGIKGLRAKARDRAPDRVDIQPVPTSTGKQIFTGFLCNALNPKAPIYFLSLFTIVLSPNLPLPVLTIYGVWIMLLQLLWFSTVTVIFTRRSVRARFLSAGHWIDRVFGLAMVALGIRVLTSSHQ